MTLKEFAKDCFRPLIRGFFFYELKSRQQLIVNAFPSPHSGILFLFDKYSHVMAGSTVSFRPLIRGFFFYVQCK